MSNLKLKPRKLEIFKHFLVCEGNAKMDFCHHFHYIMNLFWRKIKNMENWLKKRKNVTMWICKWTNVDQYACSMTLDISIEQWLFRSSCQDLHSRHKLILVHRKWMKIMVVEGWFQWLRWIHPWWIHLWSQHN
jgi:hypothetical protein